MSGRTHIAALTAAGFAAALLISGCSYDYLQNTDRVTYGAGDAVRANLETETTNPEKASNDDVSGLGADGVVDPAVPQQ